MRCYPCRVGTHDYCIEVGCICLSCLHQDKEQEPLQWPVKLAWLPTCALC